MVSRKQRVQFADKSRIEAEFKDLAPYTVNGKLVNIFATLMNHPKLFRAWGRFGGYILSNDQTLSPRDRETSPEFPEIRQNPLRAHLAS